MLDNLMQPTDHCSVTFVKASRLQLRPGNGRTKVAHQAGPDNHNCGPALMWVIAGQGRTEDDGACRLEIDRRLSVDHDAESVLEGYAPHITDSPVFVATALSGDPVLLTSVYSVFPTMLDQERSFIDPPCSLPQVCALVVTVHAWRLDGEPAPGVEFSWQCMVEGGRSRHISAAPPADEAL